MKNKKKMHRKEQTLEVGWCQDESFITIDDQFSRRVNNGGKKVLFGLKKMLFGAEWLKHNLEKA